MLKDGKYGDMAESMCPPGFRIMYLNLFSALIYEPLTVQLTKLVLSFVSAATLET